MAGHGIVGHLGAYHEAKPFTGPHQQESLDLTLETDNNDNDKNHRKGHHAVNACQVPGAWPALSHLVSIQNSFMSDPVIICFHRGDRGSVSLSSLPEFRVGIQTRVSLTPGPHNHFPRMPS